MKKMLLHIILLILFTRLPAQEINRITLHQVQKAYTVNRGHLYAQLPVRFFFHDQIYELAPNLTTGETYWDIQNSLAMIYGLHDKVDLSMQQIIYQDNHKPGKGYNLPDDLFLRARVTGFGDPLRPLRFGGALELRVPVAEYHNLPLEPYAADRLGVGLTFLVSHITNLDDPDYGRVLSANLGLFFHNDHGLRLTTASDDTLSAEHNSTELVYGLAMAKNLGRIDLQAELYGRAFISKPAVTAYTRENHLYFSPGLNYTLPSTIQFNFAADLRLSGDTDHTAYWRSQANAMPWKSLPNLPKWRITLGLTMPLIPFPSLQGAKKAVPGSDLSQQQLQEELYRQLAAERKKAEEAEESLARIRAERERIDKSLQHLRDILENRSSPPADSTLSPAPAPPELPAP